MISKEALAYKKFRTDHCNYIYDTNTNYVLKVDEVIYDIVEDAELALSALLEKHSNKYSRDTIITNYNNLQNFRKSHRVLNQFPLKFQKFNFNKDFQSLLSNELHHLQLNVTNDCNYRCKYCVFDDGHFGKRTHSKKHMSFHVAQKSIDYFMAHCGDNAIISFYGGEPLLNYDTVKYAVEYISTVYPTYDILLSITTNASLLDKNIIEYFIDNNVHIDISIDGPKRIHDKYRVDKGRMPTFRVVYDKIRLIKSLNENYFKKNVSFQTTFNQNDNVNSIVEFFLNDLLFEVQNGYSLNFLQIPEDGFDFSTEFNESNAFFIDDYWNAILEYVGTSHDKKIFDLKIRIMLNYFFGPALRIYRRLNRAISPVESVHPNGCCIPGHSRLFVSVRGDFYTCEKFGDGTYPIGNCERGIDFESVRKLTKEYMDLSIDDCKECWAIHLCGMCYLSAYDWNKKDFNIEIKRKNCDMHKKSIEKSLARIVQVQEINPEFIKMNVFD